MILWEVEMGFGISTLKRTISALVVGLLLFVGMIVPTEAQKRHGKRFDRDDRGRHLGWTRGRHLGRRNRDANRDRRLRRRELSRHWRDERRALRLHQRDERRTLRNSAVGDRVLFGSQRRDLSRHQRTERRELKSHQKSERRQFKEFRRNRH